jgi:hypothetical protein
MMVLSGFISIRGIMPLVRLTLSAENSTTWSAIDSKFSWTVYSSFLNIMDEDSLSTSITEVIE